MERNENNARENLSKLFPDYQGKDISEYSSNPVNPETGNRLSSRLVIWLKEEVCWYSFEKFLLNLSWPNVETVESRLMIRLWLNQADREKGQSSRRLMKPGKALKHLFPYLTDSQIEYFVDVMRRDLGERAYSVKTGESAEDFKHAYTHHQAKMENPSTTDKRKSLSCSCMRYENISHVCTDGIVTHPVEAYASGQFRMVWIEDSQGNIAARCVVWKEPDRPVAAPIYGVCEKSMNLIQDYLESLNYDQHGDWQGAELARIEARDSGYIAPYLDLQPRRLSDNGEVLIVSRHGEIDASDYQGILNGQPLARCENCGDSYNREEEGGCIDDRSVCQCCYEDSNYCEFYDEYTFDDIREVYIWNDRRGDYSTQYWCDGAISDNATRINGDYWKTDDLLQDYEGEYITPDDVYNNGEYFMSDWDGEFYPSSMLCETVEGETVGKPELGNDRGIWEQQANGLWENVQLDLELDAA